SSHSVEDAGVGKRTIIRGKQDKNQKGQAQGTAKLREIRRLTVMKNEGLTVTCATDVDKNEGKNMMVISDDRGKVCGMNEEFNYLPNRMKK
ncbi:11070_t:CDS:2, partial [Gigaspora rosea]